MNFDPEFKSFIESLFIAFPSLYQWVSEHSLEPKDTYKRWHQTLKDCSLAECMKVLDDWTTGKKEPFKAYEKDMIALVVRSCVGFDRDKRARDEANLRASRAHVEAVAKSRNSYSRCVLLMDLWPMVIEANSKLDKGEITQEQWEAERDRIAELAGRTDIPRRDVVPFQRVEEVV